MDCLHDLSGSHAGLYKYTTVLIIRHISHIQD